MSHAMIKLFGGARFVQLTGNHLRSNLLQGIPGHALSEKLAVQIDGIESLALAQHVAGMDTTTPQYAAALELALDRLIGHRPALPARPATVIQYGEDYGEDCRITINGDQIESNQREVENIDGEDDDFLAAMDGYEALVWAQYMTGIDVQSPACKDALYTSLEAIANNT